MTEQEACNMVDNLSTEFIHSGVTPAGDFYSVTDKLLSPNTAKMVIGMIYRNLKKENDNGK